jgi:hypothetical protein
VSAVENLVAVESEKFWKEQITHALRNLSSINHISKGDAMLCIELLYSVKYVN